MANYEIDITMSATTVTDLTSGGFNLYAFKAVQTQAQGGSPLVWFSTNAFMQSTQVTWEEDYQAYVSESAIVPKGQITASSTVAIDLEQTANVDSSGNLTAVDGGTASAISLNNGSSKQWTCGISQMAGTTANPMCAFPLYGNMLDVIAPIEKVLLMFATETVNTGTVIEQSYSSGVLIDLTSVQSRSVTFDINNGWSWGGASWAEAVQAQENLVPLLIDSSASLAKGRSSQRSLTSESSAHGEQSIRAGSNHTFPAGTVDDDLEIDNRHNVSGTVDYKIGNQPRTTIDIKPNKNYKIPRINGQQIQVWNNLPNTIYCVY